MSIRRSSIWCRGPCDVHLTDTNHLCGTTQWQRRSCSTLPLQQWSRFPRHNNRLHLYSYDQPSNLKITHSIKSGIDGMVAVSPQFTTSITEITITSTANDFFDSPNLRCRFGESSEVSASFDSPNQIRCTTPALTPDSYRLYVSNGDGQFVDLNVDFFFLGSLSEHQSTNL